jgi:hypothetical protein
MILSMTAPNPRYQGKPLLRLLECYVLWAIDQLSAKDADTLERMTPKLQSIYGTQGDWQHVIGAAVELPTNLPELIRDSWMKNSEIARKNGVILTPQRFAEMFVDENLVK